MVEVDVREQDGRRLAPVERRHQRLLRRLRTGVDEHVADLPAADHLVVAQVPHVDRPHGAVSYPMRENLHMSHRLPERDKPWMMRTYAGHSTAAKSNELYRRNLAKGQTGLSIAFDLPTQTGYDPDHELARGEVGKVGVPVAHKGDMHALLDGIPLDRMNTSMTINATAAWLLALYIVVAEENGIDPAVLQGTTQNDIIKEYLSRGTYAFPPGPSMRLIADMVAYETDLLEYPDIFEGSKVMDGLLAELMDGARAEMARVAEEGGAVEAVPYMKAGLVESHRERLARIEAGEQVLVGVNRFTETEPSPLAADGSILVVDPAVEQEARDGLAAWRAGRDGAAVARALDELRRVAASDENVMPATIAAARAGATTGEWAAALRDAFGSYRAPTGVGEAAAPAGGDELAALREEVARVGEALGRRVKILVGKPGLDGHSNGAEQIAVRARDAGMDVVYEGIRLTPSQIAASALQEGVHVIGLSILSGSHRQLIPAVVAALREAGVDAPVVVGGIIPEADAPALLEAGVAAVYTPKDFELNRIMREIVELVAEHHGAGAARA